MESQGSAELIGFTALGAGLLLRNVWLHRKAPSAGEESIEKLAHQPPHAPSIEDTLHSIDRPSDAHDQADELFKKNPFEDAEKNFGAFLERYIIFPPVLPPNKPFSDLTFAVSDAFDVKGHITGFGSPSWEATHEPAEKMAAIVGDLLEQGATCVGKTVSAELGFGITYAHVGTPLNPQFPRFDSGGSSGGPAVAVASGSVDFALGIDTTGDIRIPASLCGVIGYRPSHGLISTVGVVPNSGSLDCVGILARSSSVLRRLANRLLHFNQANHKSVSRQLIFARDLFDLFELRAEGAYAVADLVKGRSGYESPMHVDFIQHVASEVPSLRRFYKEDANLSEAIPNALSSAMYSLQRYEWRRNHDEWLKEARPEISSTVSRRVHAPVTLGEDELQLLYRVRIELRRALRTLLKDGGILVVPTLGDPPLELKSKRDSSECYARSMSLCSIASLSGCCQVTVPLGKRKGSPLSVSFLSVHGADVFLLDMVDILQSKGKLASNLAVIPAPSANIEVAKLLNEKGNGASEVEGWHSAIKYYSEAIRLNRRNASYYCNRAAAFLELSCFFDVERDCTRAIELDEKNVRAYLMRGTAREMFVDYANASQDFKRALVLEPGNRVAVSALQKLEKLSLR